ncbi:MAG TPA: M66 family metalloprotease [Acinetobacter lwoffii]|uniref:M66 family metalloprotease n=1 Tax=Acinetobacter lwoffii TaxID=28090 RepID=A0A9D2UT63_ACILW|nr:M66 family metalloprotease [Acinetobacter lwoffii]
MKNVIRCSHGYLSVCVLSLMLVACGGGENDQNTDQGGNQNPNELYPEPTVDASYANTLGFYDYDAESKTRTIRHDLKGEFQAMVQFGQQHVVDPNGNEAKQMPRLTSEKEALLLVTPVAEMQDITSLQVDIYQGNQLLRTVKLADPTRIPASDQKGRGTRPSLQYSKRAWSVRLNWNEVKPGLKLRFSDSKNRSGELAEEAIDFAAPGELVLNNIRIGMLTDAPVSGGHKMLLEPEKSGTDYFQTIPAAHMTVAKYDDISLDKVMIASGVIYDKNTGSAGSGDVYSGDMRENVGKSTFSVGINLANWGITSASMASQAQPQLTQSVVAHHSRGKYTNGESSHGLSGGNGMLTLYDSIGNEFSHEIGHHYGLGHYPGRVQIDQDTVNDFLTAHHADSGWGYISYRNKMRGNLSWSSTSLRDGSNGIPNFLNLFRYGTDSMAGGYPDSTISNYTHYTGYSTYLRIQPHFDRAVWDETSPTGYKTWNKQTRTMEVYQPQIPAKMNAVWFNRPDGYYLKPRLFGVPVFTILGGYDPVNQVGLLYPEARGNWGNVFNLPEADLSSENAACWLKVHYLSHTKTVALAPSRLGSNANKLHVNLAISDQPKTVDLYCKNAGEEAKQLSHLEIKTYPDAIKPAVKIGRQAGYSALRAIELPALEEALEAQAASTVINLNAQQQLIADSYTDHMDKLSPLARQQLIRYQHQQNIVPRFDRWIAAYQQDFSAGKAQAITSFEKLMVRLGLNNDNILAGAMPIKNNGKNCLKTETLTDGSLNLYISGPSACTGDLTEQWMFDVSGRIHSAKDPGQCVTSTGSYAKVIMAVCDANNSNQIWTMKPENSTIIQAGQCFDLGNGYLTNNRTNLLRYACNNTAAQIWNTLTPSSSLILATARPFSLDLYAKYLQNKAASLEPPVIH